MKKQLIIILISLNVFSQEKELEYNSSFSVLPELAIGHSTEPNGDFPGRKPQVQVFVNLNKDNSSKPHEWVYWLNAPETGVTFGYTNFGNATHLGNAFSVMPYIKFHPFKNKRFKSLFSLGGSYIDNKFNEDTNFTNRAISTDIVFSFRSFIYYSLSKNQNSWSLGLGYSHHSNGHTKLPNQGLNSFLVSISKPYRFKSNKKVKVHENTPEASRQNYWLLQSGLGMNVLSIPESFNDLQPVHTLSIGHGKIINSTYKLGIGAYYNYYRHYYNYLTNNESLVQDGREFDYLTSNPVLNASAFGVFAEGELLLSHIGINARLGFNVFKPAYDIDWRINRGNYFFPRDIPEDFPKDNLGEYNTYFKMKKHIAFRIGFNAYLVSTAKKPKHNVYLGVYINSNLGQADFVEASLGYIFTLDKKNKN